MKNFSYFWQYLAKFFLEWKNVLNKSCRENKNTHFKFNAFFLQNSVVYEMMSKNVVKREKSRMTSDAQGEP
jgi:hypothetical protein